MSTGIEHRQITTIMDCYTNYDKPNFSIWAGPTLRIKYEGGNVDIGYQQLLDYLNLIQSSDTRTVYTLRVYPATTTGINNKTEYEGSTSFMLTTTPTITNDLGKTVFVGNNTPVKADPLIQQQLEQL